MPFFIFFSIILSCVNNSVSNKNELNIERIYYDSGNIKEEIIYFSDDSLDLKYILYSEDGLVIDSFRVLNGNVEGKRYEYYYDKGYVAVSNFNKNVSDGKYEEYYIPDMQLYGFGEIKDEKLVNAWYCYYPSGKLKSYTFYNTHHEIIYQRRYDKDGKLSFSGGDGISQLIMEKDTFNIGEVYTGWIEYVNHPNCIVRSYLKLQNWSKKSILKPYDDNSSILSFRLKDKGCFTHELYWELEDTLTGEKEKDRVIFNVVVE